MHNFVIHMQLHSHRQQGKLKMIETELKFTVRGGNIQPPNLKTTPRRKMSWINHDGKKSRKVGTLAPNLCWDMLDSISKWIIYYSVINSIIITKYINNWTTKPKMCTVKNCLKKAQCKKSNIQKIMNEEGKVQQNLSARWPYEAKEKWRKEH